MQPCNLSPTQSQTHLQFECTPTHTHTYIYTNTHTHGWHTGCLESKTIFPGSFSQGRHHSNWLTLNIPLSLWGSLKPALSGVHACARVCVMDWHSTLQGCQTDLWRYFGKCVCSYPTQTHRPFKGLEHHPWEEAMTSITITNTSVCTSPAFRLESLKYFAFLFIISLCTWWIHQIVFCTFLILNKMKCKQQKHQQHYHIHR